MARQVEARWEVERLKCEMAKIYFIVSVMSMDELSAFDLCVILLSGLYPNVLKIKQHSLRSISPSTAKLRFSMRKLRVWLLSVKSTIALGTRFCCI